MAKPYEWRASSILRVPAVTFGHRGAHACHWYRACSVHASRRLKAFVLLQQGQYTFNSYSPFRLAGHLAKKISHPFRRRLDEPTPWYEIKPLIPVRDGNCMNTPGQRGELPLVTVRPAQVQCMVLCWLKETFSQGDLASADQAAIMCHMAAVEGSCMLQQLVSDPICFSAERHGMSARSAYLQRCRRRLCHQHPCNQSFFECRHTNNRGITARAALQEVALTVAMRTCRATTSASTSMGITGRSPRLQVQPSTGFTG